MGWRVPGWLINVCLGSCLGILVWGCGPSGSDTVGEAGDAGAIDAVADAHIHEHGEDHPHTTAGFPAVQPMDDGEDVGDGGSVPGDGAGTASELSTEDAEALRVLLGLPEGMVLPAIPDYNPLTQEKIELGRHLFYDRMLSGNETQACSDCHEQHSAFTDGRRTAVGSTGEVLTRNSMSLANVAYFSTLTWAHNGFFELEDQLPVPIANTTPTELGVTDRNQEEVLNRFASDPSYAELFEAAFPAADGSELVTMNKIVFALASFCRSLISVNSRYDRYERGDKSALTESELRGLALFEGERFECFHCHSGVLFSSAYRDARIPKSDVRAQFFNTGLYNVDGEGSYPGQDQGLYELTERPADRGLFRPPSLRNIAVTGPYMHDGSMETLQEVVEHYVSGGRNLVDGPFSGDGRLSPLKSSLVRAIQATPEEIADLVAFLNTLTDEEFLTNPQYSNPFE